jgi:hypothetical protein
MNTANAPIPKYTRYGVIKDTLDLRRIAFLTAKSVPCDCSGRVASRRRDPPPEVRVFLTRVGKFSRN